jgi:hypothetical protein
VMQTVPPVYVVDFMTGRKVRGFIPDPSAPGKYLCNFGDCRNPTGHRNYAVCWKHTSQPFREHRVATEHAETFDREFMADMKICDPPPVARGLVYTELAICADIVGKRRKFLASRRRRSDATRECGHYDLGEFAV